MAKKYGEENIMSFYVHLDQMSPHIHCTLVPVDAEKNRISWTSVFGQNMKEESFNMTKLHSELEREVNRKWGLQRGNNTIETKARYRSLYEYKLDLVREVTHFLLKKDKLDREIHEMEARINELESRFENLLDIEK